MLRHPAAADGSPMSSRAKKAECLKFSSRGPLRSAASTQNTATDDRIHEDLMNLSSTNRPASAADCREASSLAPHTGPMVIDTHNSRVAEISMSQQSATGDLIVDPQISPSGRPLTPPPPPAGKKGSSTSRAGTPNRSATTYNVAVRTGNTTPIRAVTPRSPSLASSHPAGTQRSRVNAHIHNSSLTEGSPMYERSPARNAAPPLTSAQQQQRRLRSDTGRNVSPTSSPAVSLSRSPAVARTASKSPTRVPSSGSPMGTIPTANRTTSAGASRKLTAANFNTSFATDDSVLQKYDPIALLQGKGVQRPPGDFQSPTQSRSATGSASPNNNTASSKQPNTYSGDALMFKALAGPSIAPKENRAQRARRSFSAEREVASQQKQQHDSLLNNNAKIGIVIREAKRSVSPNTNRLGASASRRAVSPNSTSSPLGASASSAHHGSSTSTNTSPNYRQRRDDTTSVTKNTTIRNVGSPPMGVNVSTSVSSARKSPTSRSCSPPSPARQSATCTTKSNRCTTPRGTVVTADYGTAVSYSCDGATTTSHNTSVTKALVMDESTLTTATSANGSPSSQPLSHYNNRATTPYASNPDTGSPDGTMPLTIALQCRGNFTPLRNTFTPRGKRKSLLVYEEVCDVKQRQQEKKESVGGSLSSHVFTESPVAITH